MKRILLVLGVLIVSALLFARGSGRGQSGRGDYYHRGYMMEEYAERKLSDNDYKKFEAMQNKHFQENEKLLIEIRAKNLEMERLTIQDKVDWEKVNKLNSEKYRLMEKLDGNRLRYREEIRKTFGDDFIGEGYMRGYRDHHMMDDYEGHHMRRY